MSTHSECEGEGESGREREREGGRDGGRKKEIHHFTFTLCLFHRKDWAAHFPVRNLNALSAYPVIVNPTHYVGDEGWFSDTEPPPDILAQIRERKKREEAEEKRKLMEEKTHQERVKEDAINRQIQAMRQKLKATKTEL